MKVIDQNIKNLQKLCNQHHVDTMYLFGSAVKDSLGAESDIDFLVKFKPIDLVGYFDNYINFKQSLKKLLGREIDLVEEQTLKNPILINSINKNKELVYG